MTLNVGDVVQICEEDRFRGGESAEALTSVESSPLPVSTCEHAIQFENPPRKSRNSDRILFRVHQEEQLIG